ncbi:hypothetical protein, partial [Escherichia coli]|uniref:hypothetical protein n=1 Tax=Escherichia coli TaxID=562 RepID=UPI001BC8AE0F
MLSAAQKNTIDALLGSAGISILPGDAFYASSTPRVGQAALELRGQRRPYHHPEGQRHSGGTAGVAEHQPADQIQRVRAALPHA